MIRTILIVMMLPLFSAEEGTVDNPGEKKMEWDLTQLFENAEVWEKQFAGLDGRIQELDKYKELGTLDDETVLVALKLSTELTTIADRLAQYAFQQYSTDRNNAGHQEIYEKSEYLLAKLEQAKSYFEPELLAMPLERVEGFIANKGYGDYDHFLRDLLRRKPHVLDVSGESVLSHTRALSATPYSVLNSLQSEIPFPEITDEKGGKTRLSFSNFPKFRGSLNREVRKQAAEQFFGTLGKFSKTFAASLAMKVKADVYLAKAQGYGSALEASLDRDAVTTDLYNTLIEVTAENLPKTLHRYVALKKRILGLSEVHYYDLYVPIYQADKTEYNYDLARKLTLESMRPMGEGYVKILEAGLEPSAGWAHVYPAEGKRSGAYCTGAHGYHPYVFLNHLDRLDDVFTVTHEFGHAMHFVYSQSNQPFPKADSPILLAEIPSTFQEAMLMDHLLKQAKDKAAIMALLVKRLENIRLTIIRQVMFAEFEKLIHAEVEKGGALTASRMSEIYSGLITKYYGPDFTQDEWDKFEWAYIPHFYYDFYVYKYATGLMASNAFAKKILGKDKASSGEAIEKYIEFLKGGGSDYPVELLSAAGLDLLDPQVMQATYDIFEETISKLEMLED